ncbi:uncharacterized protein LOC100907487 [Galendromus occidentalis]|uniref:Uncharacterized protein LOC100907487 n=1 Tax=Galendromus occidentalis TaxID=34638 RepID=A0AAJ7SHB1_9ACAR|nr:uncharacterized protein LOC100907487 [Galendromus occidentalis]
MSRVALAVAILIAVAFTPTMGWAFEEDELTASWDSPTNSNLRGKLYSYTNRLDDEEPRVTVSGVQGGHVGLPCNIQPNSTEDEVSLVLWYKDDSTTPIYSLDSRKTTLRNAHHAPVHWLSERAYLRTIPIARPNNASRSKPTNTEVTPNAATSLLELKNLEKEDEALYRCRVDFKRARTRNYEVQLKVIVPPSRLTVVDQRGTFLSDKAVIGPFTEGEKLVLKCQAHGGVPPPVVTWYRGSSSTVKETVPTQVSQLGTELKLLSSAANVQHGSFVESELVLQSLTRDDLLAALICVASNNNVSQPLMSSVVLDIYFRPQRVWITSPSPEIILAGMTTVFKCSSAGSRPPAMIQWFKGDEKMTNTTIVVSSNSSSSAPLPALPSKLTGDDWHTSVLEFVPSPDDDGKQLTCKADNPAMPTRGTKGSDSNAIVDGVKLKVHYVPQPTVRLGTKLRHSHIREGHDVFLECDVKANPPLIEMGWAFEGQELKTDLERGVVISENSLVLQKVTRLNRGRYVCTGTNSEGQGKSPPFQLRVRYEPTCKPGQRQMYGAAKNETVRISCELDGDPPDITFRWRIRNSKGEITNIPTPTGGSKTGGGNSNSNAISLDDDAAGTRDSGFIVQSEGTQSWLTIVPKSEDDYGTIICWGRNPMGMQTEPCLFSLTSAGPPGPVHNCSVINQTEESITISCLEGYDGGSEGGQMFHMEVHDSANQNRVLIANLSTTIAPPSLQAKGLSPSTPYVCTIYASNERGTSQPTILVASTIPKPLSLSSKGGFLFGYLDGRFKPSPFVVLGIAGAILAIILSTILVVAVALKAIRANHLAGNHRGHKKKLNDLGFSIDDDESVFPLRDIEKRNSPTVTDLKNFIDDEDDSRGPDIIPETLKLTSPSCSTLGALESSFIQSIGVVDTASAHMYTPQSDFGSKILNDVTYLDYSSLKRGSWDIAQRQKSSESPSIFQHHMVTLPRRPQQVQQQQQQQLQLPVGGTRTSAIANETLRDHSCIRYKTLTIQGQVIPVAKNYKYLGVTLSDSRNYLNAQEEAWMKGATSALHAMHATSLWGFNRFEISRVQWKATAVPKLTYANSVLTYRLQFDQEGRPLSNIFNKKIKERIRETQEAMWRDNMLLKTSLTTYAKGKKTRGVTSFTYDNSKGSALLALARANMLPTRAHKMYPGTDKTCPRCGIYEETMEHVIFECNDIYYTGEELLCRLGLHEGANNATEVSGRCAYYRHLVWKSLTEKYLHATLMEPQLPSGETDGGHKFRLETSSSTVSKNSRFHGASLGKREFSVALSLEPHSFR